MRRLLFFVAIGCFSLPLIHCSKSTEPRTDPKIQGKVMRQEDGVGISGANVVLYDANANTPMARSLTNAQGNFSFTVLPGSYYLTAAAQGRIPSPPPHGGKPLPFQADAGGTYTRDLYLDIDSTAAGTGGISGAVTVSGSSARGGILIVATSGATSFSTVTGPDGVFLLYNLPAGAYALRGYKSGLAQDTAAVSANVTAGGVAGGVSLGFAVDLGKILRGRITFLASPNSTVDITLVNPLTRDAIPGLSTANDANNNFTLTGIPSGDYLTRASFHNDGYVMDPDRIRSSGLPLVSFLPSDTAKTQDCDVTDAIPVVSPTNPADSIYPVSVNVLTPMFKWAKYPSAKEYIVEVFDANGKRVWGGYDSAGVVRHTQVVVESAGYNFDGSAVQPLKSGSIYSWKVYADGDAAANIQGLISSSEDLRGIFRVVP